jgi:hypothetical protein
MTPRLDLRLASGRFAVCRLDASAEIPGWALGGGEFTSITRTAAELSIVCAEAAVPEGTKCERGWRLLAVEGPLDFALTGILVSLARPLADARISIFAISTYDTDCLMVREQDLAKAVHTLEAAGHTVKQQ